MIIEQDDLNFKIECESKDELLLMKILAALMQGVDEYEWKQTIKRYLESVKTCPAETIDRNNGMIFQCGLPAGHKGNKHSPLMFFTNPLPEAQLGPRNKGKEKHCP